MPPKSPRLPVTTAGKVLLAFFTIVCLGIGLFVSFFVLFALLYAESGGPNFDHIPVPVRFSMGGLIIGPLASLPFAVWRRSWRPVAYCSIVVCVLCALLGAALQWNLHAQFREIEARQRAQ